jgi:hypothetical protein
MPGNSGNGEYSDLLCSLDQAPRSLSKVVNSTLSFFRAELEALEPLFEEASGVRRRFLILLFADLSFFSRALEETAALGATLRLRSCINRTH